MPRRRRKRWLSAEDLAEQLASFGLTHNEAVVLLALLRLGEATARQAYVESRLERAEVYRILDRLHKRGIVNLILNEPKTFKALPLKKAMALLIKSKEGEIAKLRQLQEEIKKTYEQIEVTVKKDRTEETFQVIRGGPAVYSLLGAMLNRVKHKSMVRHLATVDGSRRFFTAVGSSISKATKKGVNYRLLTQIETENLSVVRQLMMTSEIRHTDKATINMVVIDSSEAFICWCFTSTISIYAREITALWTNSLHIIKALQVFFEEMWGGSETIEERFTELKSRPKSIG